MILQKLRVRDFGPISSLDLVPTGGVLGVIGENGQGKSHIPTALRYLFTGQLDETAESYIRRGANHAELEVTFEAGGKIGRLSRKILPYKTSIEFDWEEKTYTQAAAVLNLIEDIFQVKRDIISKIAFCPQGYLTNLLFGGDAARETLFSDLMGVDFSKSRDTLAIKINVLRNKLSNTLPLIEQEENNRTEIQAAIRQTEEELSKLDADSLKQWEALKKTVKDINQLRSLKQSAAAARTEIANLTTQLATLEADFTTHQSAVQKLEEYQKNLKGWQDVLQRQRNAKGMLDQLQQLNLQLQGLDVEITDLTNKLTSLRGSVGADAELKLSSLQELPQRLSTQIENRKQWDADSKEVERLTEALTTCGEDALKAQTEQVNTLDNRLRELIADRTRLTRVQNMQKEIAQCTLGPDMTCPQCSLKLDKEALSQLSADTVRIALEQVAREVQEKSATLATEKTALEELRQRNASLVSNLKLHTDRKAKLQQYSAVDIQAAEKERTAATEEFNRISRTLSEIREQQTLLTHKQDSRDQVATRVAEVKKFVETQVAEDLVTKMEQASDAVRQWNDLVAEQEKLRDGVKANAETYTGVLNKKRVQEESLERCEKDIRVIIEATPQLDQVDAQQLERYMKELEGFDSLSSQVLTLNSLLSERTSALQRCEKSLEKLRAREADDLQLRKAIQNLETTRNLLARTGLPGIYLREKFQQLVDLTRFYLEKTDASFTVFAAEKGLSFTYLDPERDPTELFKMEKLSGGQRVRLSIAFMLAASQLMVPTFKLISFDEPSTHLDEKGADSLIGLFESLKPLTESSNQQVLIIDHVPEFARAFSTTVRL